MKEKKEQSRENPVIRWSIPVLSVLICLSVRFSHFRWQALALLLCLAGSIFLFCGKRRIIKRKGPAVAVSLLLLLFLAGYHALAWGIHHTRYPDHGLDRNLYQGKKILVLVPHQDDEINLFGGLYEIFEQGSEVYVVYSTNGDKVVPGETRIEEAASALTQMGLPRDHILFLGYGDSIYSEESIHLYNLPGDQLTTSPAGYTETYAGAGFHPYRESAYTRDHLKADMQAVLLDLRPDVIFCIDFDYHHDHRALSLLFEETMGEILRREGNDYTPAVFKGFGYSTAYLGTWDFYAENILSTVPYSDAYPAPGTTFLDEEGTPILIMGENNIYLWRERIRFPVAEETLARTLHASSLYGPMQAHVSQNDLYDALANLEGILNGDKVFWPRYTSGILYRAEAAASSGEPDPLTDFKLIDSGNVDDKERMPFDNLWIPDPEDSLKRVTFTFPEETAISALLLYDNPSLSENITRLRISFSDGSALECGPLRINGSATPILFEEKAVTSLAIEILEYEGEHPGLTEVEAYEENPAESLPEIIKLQDADGNFVYDCWLSDGQQVFSVYNSLDAYGLGASEAYSLWVQSGNCDIQQREDGAFLVSCGKGQSAVLGLYREGGDAPLDLVTVRNPGWIEREWNRLLVEAERNFDLPTPAEQWVYFQETIADYWQKLTGSDE